MTEYALLWDSNTRQYGVIARDYLEDWYMYVPNIPKEAAATIADALNAKERSS